MAPDLLNLIKAANLIESPTGSFQCFGYLKGLAHNGVPFELREVKARQHPDQVNLSTPLLGNTDHAGFEGIIASFYRKTNFFTRTIVIADSGHFNPKEVLGMKRVGLVSAEFERQFEVYGDDQVEARALVTPDFMEDFMRFNDPDAPKGVQCIFLGNKMHLIVPQIIGGSFSADYVTRDAPSVFQRCFGEVGGVFDIIDVLQTLSSDLAGQRDERAQTRRQAYYRKLLDNLKAQLTHDQDAMRALDAQFAAYSTGG